MLPLGAKGHPKKNPTPVMRIPLLSCWSRLYKRLPKYYGVLLMPWLPTPEVEVTIVKDSMCFRHMAQRLLS